MSRFTMSFALISVPTILMLGLQAMGLKPMTFVGKKLFEVGTITFSLLFAYPISAAIFPPTSKICTTQCEPDVEHLEEVYFNKGV